MGKFYKAKATVPVIPGAAVVPPAAYPIGPIVSAQPQGFSPYLIRPEIHGAYPQKQIVPPLWDERTELSFIRGQNVGFGRFGRDLVEPAPVGAARGALVSAIAASAPPMTTVSTVATARAERSSYIAADSQTRAAVASQVANSAARTADAAFIRATKDPSPDVQADAAAKVRDAQIADQLAQRAKADAAAKARQADIDAWNAKAKAEQEIEAEARRNLAMQDSIAQADAQAVATTNDQNWVPPELQQQVTVPSVTASPMMGAGIGAALGYLLGGTRGAALGALLGGGGLYLYGRNQ